MNSGDFYHQQKKVEQDRDRAGAKGSKHGTIETWQIEQEDAERGEFVADPMDKDAAPPKKQGILGRLTSLFNRKKG